MTTRYRISLDLTDPMQGGLKSHKPVKLGEMDLPDNIPIVTLPVVGRIPAIVGVHLSLEQKTSVTMTDRLHTWKMSIDPSQEDVLKRLLNPGQGVRYDAAHAIKGLLKRIAPLHPPLETVIQLALTVDASGERFLDWQVNTLTTAVRDARVQARLAKHHNDLFLARWHRFNWLVMRPGVQSFFARRGWDTLREIPMIPTEDTWVATNEEVLDQIFGSEAVPILETLWKAAFAHGEGAIQLSTAGFDLDRIGQTQLGGLDLAESIHMRRGKLTQMTRLPRAFLDDTD